MIIPLPVPVWFALRCFVALSIPVRVSLSGARVLVEYWYKYCRQRQVRVGDDIPVVPVPGTIPDTVWVRTVAANEFVVAKVKSGKAGIVYCVLYR